MVLSLLNRVKRSVSPWNVNYPQLMQTHPLDTFPTVDMYEDKVTPAVWDHAALFYMSHAVALRAVSNMGDYASAMAAQGDSIFKGADSLSYIFVLPVLPKNDAGTFKPSDALMPFADSVLCVPAEAAMKNPKIGRKKNQMKTATDTANRNVIRIPVERIIQHITVFYLAPDPKKPEEHLSSIVYVLVERVKALAQGKSVASVVKSQGAAIVRLLGAMDALAHEPADLKLRQALRHLRALAKNPSGSMPQGDWPGALKMLTDALKAAPAPAPAPDAKASSSLPGTVSATLTIEGRGDDVAAAGDKAGDKAGDTAGDEEEKEEEKEKENAQAVGEVTATLVIGEEQEGGAGGDDGAEYLELIQRLAKHQDELEGLHALTAMGKDRTTDTVLLLFASIFYMTHVWCLRGTSSLLEYAAFMTQAFEAITYFNLKNKVLDTVMFKDPKMPKHIAIPLADEKKAGEKFAEYVLVSRTWTGTKSSSSRPFMIGGGNKLDRNVHAYAFSEVSAFVEELLGIQRTAGQGGNGIRVRSKSALAAKEPGAAVATTVTMPIVAPRPSREEMEAIGMVDGWNYEFSWYEDAIMPATTWKYQRFSKAFGVVYDVSEVKGGYSIEVAAHPDFQAYKFTSEYAWNEEQSQRRGEHGEPPPPPYYPTHTYVTTFGMDLSDDLRANSENVAYTGSSRATLEVAKDNNSTTKVITLEKAKNKYSPYSWRAVRSACPKNGVTFAVRVGGSWRVVINTFVKVNRGAADGSITHDPDAFEMYAIGLNGNVYHFSHKTMLFKYVNKVPAAILSFGWWEQSRPSEDVVFDSKTLKPTDMQAPTSSASAKAASLDLKGPTQVVQRVLDTAYAFDKYVRVHDGRKIELWVNVPDHAFVLRETMDSDGTPLRHTVAAKDIATDEELSLLASFFTEDALLTHTAETSSTPKDYEIGADSLPIGKNAVKDYFTPGMASKNLNTQALVNRLIIGPAVPSTSEHYKGSEWGRPRKEKIQCGHYRVADGAIYDFDLWLDTADGRAYSLRVKTTDFSTTTTSDRDGNQSDSQRRCNENLPFHHLITAGPRATEEEISILASYLDSYEYRISTTTYSMLKHASSVTYTPEATLDSVILNLRTGSKDTYSVGATGGDKGKGKVDVVVLKLHPLDEVAFSVTGGDAAPLYVPAPKDAAQRTANEAKLRDLLKDASFILRSDDYSSMIAVPTGSVDIRSVAEYKAPVKIHPAIASATAAVAAKGAAAAKTEVVPTNAPHAAIAAAKANIASKANGGAKVVQKYWDGSPLQMRDLTAGMPPLKPTDAIKEGMEWHRTEYPNTMRKSTPYNKETMLKLIRLYLYTGAATRKFTVSLYGQSYTLETNPPDQKVCYKLAASAGTFVELGPARTDCSESTEVFGKKLADMLANPEFEVIVDSAPAVVSTSCSTKLPSPENVAAWRKAFDGDTDISAKARYIYASVVGVEGFFNGREEDDAGWYGSPFTPQRFYVALHPDAGPCDTIRLSIDRNKLCMERAALVPAKDKKSMELTFCKPERVSRGLLTEILMTAGKITSSLEQDKHGDCDYGLYMPNPFEKLDDTMYDIPRIWMPSLNKAGTFVLADTIKPPPFPAPFTKPASKEFNWWDTSPPCSLRATLSIVLCLHARIPVTIEIPAPSAYSPKIRFNTMSSERFLASYIIEKHRPKPNEDSWDKHTQIWDCLEAGKPSGTVDFFKPLPSMPDVGPIMADLLKRKMISDKYIDLRFDKPHFWEKPYVWDEAMQHKWCVDFDKDPDLGRKRAYVLARFEQSKTFLSYFMPDRFLVTSDASPDVCIIVENGAFTIGKRYAQVYSRTHTSGEGRDRESYDSYHLAQIFSDYGSSVNTTREELEKLLSNAVNIRSEEHVPLGTGKPDDILLDLTQLSPNTKAAFEVKWKLKIEKDEYERLKRLAYKK